MSTSSGDGQFIEIVRLLMTLVSFTRKSSANSVSEITTEKSSAFQFDPQLHALDETTASVHAVNMND